MTRPLHVCRHCDDLITDPEDAVAVAHELSGSGPGWTIWAHREHADLVDPGDLVNPDLLRIMTRIWAVRQRDA